ncbi:MAG: 2-C-methyl-D-erythritol 4-phosphate cytidylyltransferase [Hydrogenothermaceae bacterium]|nr:2-C-methyl-D-erythritol 4-phosphate cytidylyltransferase [Hydrogenothermaceae bacterium]
MVVCILLAAGEGKRFGTKKQFVNLCGKRLLDFSIRTVEEIPDIDKIVIVLPKEDINLEITSKKEFIKIEGGSERQESVFNGLLAIKEAEIVVIHDSARPFATKDMFMEGIKNVKDGWDGSITAYKSVDTVKKVIDNQIMETLNRENIYIVQTPQTFKYEKLLKAHINAKEKDIKGTDDSYLMEVMGYKITVNQGSFLNFKITNPEDILLAQCICNRFSKEDG